LVFYVKDKYVELYNVRDIHLFKQKSFKLKNREEGEEEGKVGRKNKRNVGKTGTRFAARQPSKTSSYASATFCSGHWPPKDWVN
jgi:hypothetical protein